MSTSSIPPNQTLYVQGLNDKVSKTGLFLVYINTTIRFENYGLSPLFPIWPCGGYHCTQDDQGERASVCGLWYHSRSFTSNASITGILSLWKDNGTKEVMYFIICRGFIMPRQRVMLSKWEKERYSWGLLDQINVHLIFKERKNREQREPKLLMVCHSIYWSLFSRWRIKSFVVCFSTTNDCDWGSITNPFWTVCWIQGSSNHSWKERDLFCRVWIECSSCCCQGRSRWVSNLTWSSNICQVF